MRTASFPPEASSIENARRLAREAADECGVGVPDDVVLVASELASNAVSHARTPYTVTLVWSSPVMRVEVGDDNDHLPTESSGRELDRSGFGLRVVETLSRAWGVRRRPSGGKVVWAEVG